MGLFNWKKNKAKKAEKEKEIEKDNLINDDINEQENVDIEEQQQLEQENISNEEHQSIEQEDISNEEQSLQDVNTDVIEEQVIEEDTNMEDQNDTPEEEKGKNKKGFFGKLVKGLTKTRNNILGSVDQVLNSFTKIDEDFYEELEEALIIADLGVNTAIKIMEDLKSKVKEQKIKDTAQVRELLMEELKQLMKNDGDIYDFTEKKSVVLVIGVNGVGKTTTIGKLAHQYKDNGKKVILAAADTFRAAAIDQLAEWSNRAGVELISQQENSDPGAVVFDAVQAAKARNSDILICDTAGRLHNKKNLMEELRKIFKIINREYSEAHKEVLLVLDSTTGQNALQQAKQFKDIADITGIVLTKLDGTAKGGIAIAIQTELNIPVKYIGVGEGIDDLQKFDSDDFVNALFDQ
ncbi:signal recognition particle receptor FtsY [Vallitalea longa]|uniref:Signal recognition particle receptor FtsY n=2 Tax=Vallitalea longa TaxID=2936439 RepID=A0A9W5YFH0_9FIRM|nr:signal recognition particle receptor FtsY [Vallitalea longa]